MKKIKFLMVFATLALMISGCSANQPAADSTTAGEIPTDLKPAPQFTLENVAGGTMSSEDLNGKIVIVDFWATWCAPCIEEIPNYNELSAKYADKGVVILGVTLESGSIDEVKTKVAELNMKFPIVMGNDEMVEGFGGVLGFPTTFVVTADGKIYQKYLGLRANKRKLIEKDIETLLARNDVKVTTTEY